MMGRFVIVAYKPLPGKEADLEQLVREHVDILRTEGLATNSPDFAMRASNGSIVEVFEWESEEAMKLAHTNPTVLALWKRFYEASTFETLSSLDETKELFASFDAL